MGTRGPRASAALPRSASSPRSALSSPFSYICIQTHPLVLSLLYVFATRSLQMPRQFLSQKSIPTVALPLTYLFCVALSAVERDYKTAYLLGCRLPVVQLRARLPLCVRALLTVMRGLPEHAISQVQELRATLTGLLHRCLIEGRPLPTPVRARRQIHS